MRFVRRIFWHFGKSGTRLLLRPAGQERRHRSAYRGARVLRCRAYFGKSGQGFGHRPQDLRDGRLVQGLRVKVRRRPERKPEHRQQGWRAAEYHDQIARGDSQGRHDADRRLHRVRRNTDRPRHQPYAGAGLRSGIDAGPCRVGRDRRRIYDRKRHDHRQRHHAGDKTRVEQPRF